MLLEKMQELAGEMNFEEAQKIKEKYLLMKIIGLSPRW